VATADSRVAKHVLLALLEWWGWLLESTTCAGAAIRAKLAARKLMAAPMRLLSTDSVLVMYEMPVAANRDRHCPLLGWWYWSDS
jgi:hypothetical protein